VIAVCPTAYTPRWIRCRRPASTRLPIALRVSPRSRN
jgi:hypothetical protein